MIGLYAYLAPFVMYEDLTGQAQVAARVVRCAARRNSDVTTQSSKLACLPVLRRWYTWFPVRDKLPSLSERGSNTLVTSLFVLTAVGPQRPLSLRQGTLISASWNHPGVVSMRSSRRACARVLEVDDEGVVLATEDVRPFFAACQAVQRALFSGGPPSSAPCACLFRGVRRDSTGLST